MNMETSEKDEELVIPGYQDVNALVQDAFKSLMLATKASNDLPSAGDDYDFYSSFNSFRSLMEVEGQRILHLIQQIMRYHGAKGNLSTSSATVELDDKFDVLIDANDQLLERVGTFLDEAAGIKKHDTPLVVASMSTPKQNISGSWNRKKAGVSPGTSYRLLTAWNIQRPQIKFKEKVDNSLRAFVPKIKEKPNAMRPIPESIHQAQQEKDTVSTREDEEYDLNFSYPHPYQFEIDHCVPTKEQLEKRDPLEPNVVADTPITFVNTKQELEDLCRDLKKQKEISVDLEHHSYRSFQGFTCLMQISTRSSDYIVDTIELRSDLHLLNDVFTDPLIVKVFHGADMDIQWLQRDFGVYVVNMFDTGQAARVLNMPKFSLAYLLQLYCDVEADKQYQLADWRIRPLPQELIKYAREDTHYLLYIYDKLRNKLIDEGNEQKNLLSAVIQRSSGVCATKYEKPRSSEEAHMELLRKRKKDFNSRQLAAVKGLYNWRDKIARAEDESTGYVLPNHMLLQIAEILPKEMQGILACCNPIPPFVRQSLHALHQVVKEAREVPLTKPDVYKKIIKPTVSQHPKNDQNSLLHCPHDKSQQARVDRLFPFNEPETHSDTELTNSSSKVFGDFVIVKEKPVVSLFGALSTSVSGTVTDALRKSTEIKSQFSSPFHQFLPVAKSSSQSSILRPSKFGETAANVKWKLKPPTKMETPADSGSDATKQHPVKQVVTELNDAGAIPLSQQMTSKKALKRKSEDPPSKGSNETEKKPSTAAPRSNQPMKSLPPTKPLESWPPKGNASSASTSGKKKKLSMASVEASNFKAHDYSEDSFHMFTEKDKRHTKEFNARQQDFRGRGRGAGRARLNPKSGQKSMSFGKNNRGRQTQWPRRH